MSEYPAPARPLTANALIICIFKIANMKFCCCFCFTHFQHKLFNTKISQFDQYQHCSHCFARGNYSCSFLSSTHLIYQHCLLHFNSCLALLAHPLSLIYFYNCLINYCAHFATFLLLVTRRANDN